MAEETKICLIRQRESLRDQATRLVNSLKEELKKTVPDLINKTVLLDGLGLMEEFERKLKELNDKVLAFMEEDEEFETDMIEAAEYNDMIWLITNNVEVWIVSNEYPRAFLSAGKRITGFHTIIKNKCNKLRERASLSTNSNSKPETADQESLKNMEKVSEKPLKLNCADNELPESETPCKVTELITCDDYDKCFKIVAPETRAKCVAIVTAKKKLMSKRGLNFNDAEDNGKGDYCAVKRKLKSKIKSKVNLGKVKSPGSALVKCCEMFGSTDAVMLVRLIEDNFKTQLRAFWDLECKSPRDEPG